MSAVRKDSFSFVPGDIVVIHGLKSKSDWNYKKAVVIQLVSSKDRYAVKILSYYNNTHKTALLKATNLTFVSKQKYIHKLEGKITSKVMPQNEDDTDDIYTEFTWKIPTKQLLIYTKLTKDCSCFSPIFEYKGMLFILELIPNGYYRVNKNCVSSYQLKNNRINIAAPDNEGYVSLILTCLSIPFNVEQVELDYSIQINSISDTFRRYTQTFRNDKPQSIWQRITTTDILKSLKKIKITTTFKSFSMKLNRNINKIINCNDLLHFSWNFSKNKFEDIAPCKQFEVKEITTAIFQHHNEWKWKFQLFEVHEKSKLILELIHKPDYVQSVNIMGLMKCSQLNVGGLICHTYDKNDSYLAEAASFCTASYLKSNITENVTFEIIMNIAECIDINGNSVPIDSRQYVKPNLNVNELIIANWIRNNVECGNFIHELATMIAVYLIIKQEIMDRIINFENDDELKSFLNVYPHSKCINVKHLEGEDLTPFKNNIINKNLKIQNYYLVTFEDCTTSLKPLFERKRASEIIWECKGKGNKIILMPEMGEPDIGFLCNITSTDCIQYQLIKRGYWRKMNLTISYFGKSATNRNFKDLFKACFNFDSHFFEKDTINNRTERAIRYRAWNPHIMQYEDFDVTEQVQKDDYWNIVDKRLEELYIKIRATKMFKKNEF